MRPQTWIIVFLPLTTCLLSLSESAGDLKRSGMFEDRFSARVDEYDTTLTSEGSGYDGSDDDGSDYYDDGYDYDRGGGGGGGDEPTIQENLTGDGIARGEVAVRCLYCHGNEVSGCDINGIMKDIRAHTAICLGKCLNISAGPDMTVYDCAHDMNYPYDSCLENGETRMCFCTGDYCNAPPEVVIVDKEKYIPLVLPPASFFNTKKTLDDSSGSSQKYSPDRGREDNGGNIALSGNGESSSERSPHHRNLPPKDDAFPVVKETEIDVILPERHGRLRPKTSSSGSTRQVKHLSAGQSIGQLKDSEAGGEDNGDKNASSRTRSAYIPFVVYICWMLHSLFYL